MFAQQDDFTTVTRALPLHSYCHMDESERNTARVLIEDFLRMQFPYFQPFYAALNRKYFK